MKKLMIVAVAAVALLLLSAPPLLMPVPFKVKALVLVSVRPFRSSTAPAATDTAPAEVPKAVAEPRRRVPALMLVLPVVVLSPERINNPEPVFVIPKLLRLMYSESVS